MSLVEVILIVVKVVVVALVMMHVAIFLTWADRRQGAMIQDRVGPNRAVIWLPTKLAQLMAVAPAFAAAAGVVFLATSWEADRSTAAILFSQAGIFVTWVTWLVIAGRVRLRGPRSKLDLWVAGLEDPRFIFYAGLAFHVAALLVGSALRGTEAGESLLDGYRGAGAGLLAFSILFGAAYAA